MNNSRSFDGDANSFRPNMAQLVLEKAASSSGALTDRAGFRLKLNFGEDAKFTGGTGSDDFDFQEAYVQYMPVDNLTFQAGRMNTLIGYEVIESPLNPNFSRSFMFGIGEPFTVTGFRASFDFSDSASLAVSAINSFTGLQADDNNSKSIEALLSLAPMDNVGVSVFGFGGLRATRGQETADRMQVGGILDVQATDQLELVLEGYYGNQADYDAPGWPMPDGTAWQATPSMISTTSGDSTSGRKFLKMRQAHFHAEDVLDALDKHWYPRQCPSVSCRGSKRSDIVGNHVDPAIQAGSQSHYPGGVPVRQIRQKYL